MIWIGLIWIGLIWIRLIRIGLRLVSGLRRALAIILVGIEVGRRGRRLILRLVRVGWGSGADAVRATPLVRLILRSSVLRCRKARYDKQAGKKITGSAVFRSEHRVLNRHVALRRATDMPNCKLLILIRKTLTHPWSPATRAVVFNQRGGNVHHFRHRPKQNHRALVYAHGIHRLQRLSN